MCGSSLYKGQAIEQRDTDGMVCLTQMAKANSVNVSDWAKTDRANDYTLELARTTNKIVNDIFVSKPGSPENGGGTWAHYLLAIEFGRWISPAFAIWCDQHIHRLVTTGQTDLVKPLPLPTPKELALMLLAEIDAKERAEAKNLLLAAKIEADEPATTLGKVIESSKSQNIRIGDFAKILGDVGQNKYFAELRECKILMMGGRLPYQKFISAGYFRATEVQGTGNASDKWFPVALITPKGQAYLAKRHKQYLASIATERVIEAQVEALV